MRTDELPIISLVSNVGADDWIFDTLLILGPLVIVVIAALGRSLVTEVLAAIYIVVFVAYVGYQALQEPTASR